MISAFRRLVSQWKSASFKQEPHSHIPPRSALAPAPLLLEELEEIVLFNAVPDVTIVPPNDAVFLGDTFTFDVTFDNTGTTEGYGPIIDLIIPVTGADGAGLEADDGIDIVGGATYFGAPVTTIQLTFDSSGEVDHPFLKDAFGNPLKVLGNPGDKLVVAQLPFGSFTPDQPPITIKFTAHVSNLADLGTSLDFKARGAFMFGADSLDNPTTDPVILGDTDTDSSLWSETETITPTLARITKTNLADEHETATGPNFIHTYELHVEVAEGQTLTDFNVTDLLPPGIVYQGNLAITPEAGAVVGAHTLVSAPVDTTTPHDTPDNNLTIHFDSVTGGAGNTGFTIRFDYYVNEFATTGSHVIDPVTGDETHTNNDAFATFDWVPVDARDTLANDVRIEENPSGPDDILDNKSIAIQKWLSMLSDKGAAGYSPGDVIQFTLDFQISDYFGFSDVLITDILSDGLRLDTSFTPTLSVSEHDNMTSGGFAAANYTIASVSGVDGTQTLSFRISDELSSRGGSFADGQLVGGAIPDGGTGSGDPPAGSPLPHGATTGRITYRVIIQDQFDASPPSGDFSVDQGDVLTNHVAIEGSVLNVDDLTANGHTETDESSEWLKIVQGNITKSVYAINGIPVGPGAITVSPGDVVTYRFTAVLPNSDVEELKFTDYLPLPVFSAGEVVSLDNVHSSTAPAAGHAHFHSNDTFSGSGGVSGIVPTLTTVASGGENRLEFAYGDYDDPANSTTKIDILFSVTVGSEPFADGLFLTNQIRQQDSSSFKTGTTGDAINQIVLSEPILNMTKGVIATDHATGTFTDPVAPTSVTAPGSTGFRFGGTLNSTNLDSTPIDANLTNVDAGDLVTFAIVVENTGTSRKGAFDIEIRDLLPAGFAIPAAGVGLNLRVTDGTGATVTYTNVGGGTGLFDLGIRLDDPGATPSSGGSLENDGGAIDAYDANSGRNIIVITYDLVAETSVTPNETITNTATLQHYAGVEGGIDHTATDLTDDATVTTSIPTIDKTITSTNQAFTTGNNVTIGEIITYTVTVTLNEGTTHHVNLVDTLDQGLAFVGVTSISTNNPGDVSWTGSTTPAFAAVGAGAVNSGRQMTIDFGDVTNSNTDNSTAETITITYQAVVLNGGSNDRGDLRNNDVDLNWGSGEQISDTAPNVTIVEPTLGISKTIAPGTGDAGDTHLVTLVISHTAASDANAFNIAINDAMPAGMTISGPITITPTAGVTGLVNTSSGNTISVAADSIPDGDTITIRFNVTLAQFVQPNELLVNTADIDWSSLPGDVTTSQTSHNTLGVERTGDTTDPGGVDNDYRATGSDDVRITSPLISKQLISTSIVNANNANNQATIGETAVYEITITVPEGQTIGAAIVDNLDAGLHFVSLDSISRANSNLTTTVGSADFSDVSPFGTTVTGTSSTGERLTINLGDINNQADNVGGDTITLRYTVLIDNVAANKGAPEATPTSLDNSASMKWTLSGITQSTGVISAAPIEVIEPILTVDKSVIVNGAGTTGDSGDTVQYTFVIAHAGSSDTNAFDVTFNDVLPGVKLDNMVINSVTHSGSGDISSLFELTPGEFLRTIAGNSFDLLKGQTVTIVISGTLSGAVIPNETVTNTSSIAWTSLDGADPHERTGADDYNASDSASLTILSPVPQKSIVATSEAHTSDSTLDTAGNPRPLAIGEIVRYRLAVTLPEGTSPSFKIVDHLPTGMTLIDNSQVKVSFIADNNITESGDLAGADNDATTPSFVLPSSRISVVGQNITFDLGDLVNKDTDVGAETVIVEFNAIVQNSISNQDNSQLSNDFAVQIGGNTVATSNAAVSQVVEPNIANVLKSLLTFNGDEVTYRVTFSNTGTATAFNLNIDDAIPAAMLLQTGTVSVTFSGGSHVVTNNSTTSAIDLAIDQLAVGQTVTIDYTTTIVTPSVSTTNTVHVDYSSLPDSGTTTNPTGSSTPASGERDGSNGPGAGLNNYATTNSLSLGAIGDRVWYDIDNDGVQDAGEPGMAGVKVTLVWAGANGTFGNSDDITATTTTGVNGDYDFSGLPAGNYRVTVDTSTLPIAGLKESYDLNGIGTPSTTTTTLTAGQVRNTVDFGYTGKGSIGDRVWFDADSNGVQDAGEPGISGVTVNLDVDYDKDGTVDFTLNTTTNTSGNYTFNNLPVGNYAVRVAQPAGYDATYDADGLATSNQTTLSLGDGENNTAQDFGYTGQGSIGDRVWLDLDGDGVQDAGEPGINGVDVKLEVDLNNDNIIDYTKTITTGPDGAYLFENLPPGKYTITPTLPGGTTNTGDPDGGADSKSQLTLGVDQDNLTQDFGYQGTGSIGDRVWFDYDKDGVQDVGEAGIKGVTVALDVDFDKDGTVDTTFTTTTDSSGQYQFSHLPVGNYTVRVTAPTSYSQTFDATGPLDNKSTNSLSAGENNTAQDFGYAGSGSIGDRVWFDFNGDGVQDPGEPGYGGVTVTLGADLDQDGTVDFTTTTVTDGNGNYQFNNLPVADYTITATRPSGTTQTYDHTGPTNDNQSQVTLANGEHNTAQDFGYNGTGSIGDRVWLDVDGDGVQDTGENGIPDVTVELDVDLDGNGTTDVTFTDTTDQNGNYLFEKLPGGKYTIRVTAPTGSVQTYDLNGALDNQSTQTLSAGQNTATHDFGYRGTGSIGDRVWYDLNGDGIQDPGEPGYAGVAVTLDIDLNTDGTIDQTLSTTTDLSGNYTFNNLLPGDYTVKVTQPGGTTQTYDNSGSQSDNQSQLTLAAGGNNSQQDFGYVGTGSIGDRVWFDANKDGVQDAGEPGLDGVAVELDVDLNQDGTTDLTLSTTTDSHGNFVFDKLPVGAYTVRVTKPAGYDQTFDNDGVATSDQSVLTLGAGEHNSSQDFGYSGQGSIGDRVWFDANQDGIQDPGEPGYPSVTVQLEVDLNGDGAVDYTTTTLTDNNGLYVFSDLPPGDYTISVIDKPKGGTATYDADGGYDETSSFTLGVNEDNTSQDFGYKGAGSIGNRVWLDRNGNGLQDTDEPGVVGVTVTLGLDLTHDGIADYTTTTTTGADGQYVFNELPVGDYTITVSQPNGTVQTYDHSGALNDNQSQHTLGIDEDNTDQDFGYQGTGSIGDRVWFDINGDGIQDANEPGLKNFTVELDIDFDSDGTVDATLSTTTDDNGNYLFDHLPVADYVVRVADTAGFHASFDSDGGQDNQSAHTLTAGETNTAQDFGLRGTGSVGDKIWFDADSDGVQDAGEPGFKGVDVRLDLDIDGDGVTDFTATTTTDADGHYQFDNLIPGDYTISVVTNPPGGTPTFDADGGLDESSKLKLTADEQNTDQDFGYTGAGSIGDRVWLDLNGDGIQNPDEPGMGGVTVTLNLDINGDGTSDYTTHTLTASDGSYRFDHLPVGDYTLNVTQPTGSSQTFDGDGTLDNESQHTLGADEDNNDQDFGYQGQSSISGRVAEDADGNKTITDPEPGFKEVPIQLEADINGDGIVDFTLNTITGPQGEYTFSNLPAGDYKITIVTPPPYREQSVDPDLVNDNQTIVNLGSLEDKVKVDFGYLSDYQYSYFFDPRDMQPHESLFGHDWAHHKSILPPLADPLFTGTTEPGTTLTIYLFDESGGLITDQSVQSDAAGNWQISFSGTTLKQIPHSMRIAVTPAIYNTDTDGSFNLRRYFHNAAIGQIFANFDGSPQRVFASLPGNVLMHMEQADLNPLGFGWHRHSYEQMASSSTPMEN